MTEYGTLRVHVEPQIVRIALNREAHQNSINGAMLDELHAALDLAERAPGCRIAVIAGGGGVFCTGMDLVDATRTEGSADDVARHGGEAFLGLLKRLTTIPLAVVAEVDGRVSGGGVGIAAACDLVYATPRSTFNLPEALWGLLPCCVLPFLIRRVGFQPAYAMTLSTLPVAADRAHALHLVDELTEDPETLIRKLRSRVTKIDTATIADLKRYVRRMWLLTDDMEDLAVSEFTRLMSSSVVRERIMDFTTHQVLPWESR